MEELLYPRRFKSTSTKLFVINSVIVIILFFLTLLLQESYLSQTFSILLMTSIATWILTLANLFVSMVILSKFGLKLGRFFKTSSNKTKFAGFVLLNMFILLLPGVALICYLSSKNIFVYQTNVNPATVSLAILMYLLFFSMFLLGNRVVKVISMILLSILTLLVIFFSLYQVIKVKGNLMHPVLKNNQYILTSKFDYLISSPQRGDIVTYWAEESQTGPYLGRIIALPNEHISVQKNKIIIDGKLLIEKYINQTNVSLSNIDNFVVPNDSYIVLMDNGRKSNLKISNKLIKKKALLTKFVLELSQAEKSEYLKSNSVYLDDKTYSDPTQVQTQPDSFSLSCKTIGTKMVTASDGSGEIGCDIETNGQINTTRSYCMGEQSGKSAVLIPDAYGKQNGYYATLRDLIPSEKVSVHVFDLKGNKIECLPKLN